MKEKIQSIQYAAGDDISSKDCFNGGPLHLDNRNPQRCLFKHQDVVATVANADALLQSQFLCMSQLCLRLTLDRNDLKTTGYAGKRLPHSPKGIRSQDMNFQRFGEGLQSFIDPRDELPVTSDGSIVIQNKV